MILCKSRRVELIMYKRNNLFIKMLQLIDLFFAKCNLFFKILWQIKKQVIKAFFFHLITIIHPIYNGGAFTSDKIGDFLMFKTCFFNDILQLFVAVKVFATHKFADFIKKTERFQEIFTNGLTNLTFYVKFVFE